jgi:hypothetical protein
MNESNKIIQLKQKDVKSLRDNLLKEQKGLCLICKKEIVNACLDHHHKKRIKGSGLIRGVLCSQCNVFLGKIENNASRYGISQQNLPTILSSIIEYITKEHLPYLHPSEKEKNPILSKRCFNKLLKCYKSQYPNKKPIEYPKSKHLTKKLEKLFNKFQIPIEFNK